MVSCFHYVDFNKLLSTYGLCIFVNLQVWRVNFLFLPFVVGYDIHFVNLFLAGTLEIMSL